jgi:hypothetical protein
MTLFFSLVYSFAFMGRTHAQNVVTGNGIVCDTAEQVERFVMAKDSEAFLTKVNEEKAHSCGIVFVAFYVGKAVKRIWNEKGEWAITPILVIGAPFNGGFSAVAPTPQFTAFLVKEEGA